MRINATGKILITCILACLLVTLYIVAIPDAKDSLDAQNPQKIASLDQTGSDDPTDKLTDAWACDYDGQTWYIAANKSRQRVTILVTQDGAYLRGYIATDTTRNNKMYEATLSLAGPSPDEDDHHLYAQWTEANDIVHLVGTSTDSGDVDLTFTKIALDEFSSAVSSASSAEK